MSRSTELVVLSSPPRRFLTSLQHIAFITPLSAAVTTWSSQTFRFCATIVLRRSSSSFSPRFCFGSQWRRRQRAQHVLLRIDLDRYLHTGGFGSVFQDLVRSLRAEWKQYPPRSDQVPPLHGLANHGERDANGEMIEAFWAILNGTPAFSAINGTTTAPPPPPPTNALCSRFRR